MRQACDACAVVAAAALRHGSRVRGTPSGRRGQAASGGRQAASGGRQAARGKRQAAASGAGGRRQAAGGKRRAAGAGGREQGARKAVRLQWCAQGSAPQALAHVQRAFKTQTPEPARPFLITFRGHPPHARNCQNVVSCRLGGHPEAVSSNLWERANVLHWSSSRKDAPCELARHGLEMRSRKRDQFPAQKQVRKK